MSESKEEWSKERIQAEMEDLNRSKQTYLSVAILLILIGVGVSFTFLLPLMTTSPYSYMNRGSITEALLPEFIIAGIIPIIIAVFLLSGYSKKCRRYNELKRKL